MLRGAKRLLLQAWPLLPSSPDPGGAPSSFRGWQGYLWAGQGNRRRWNPRPPARLPPALRLSARAEPGIHFPALSDHSYHLSFQLGFLKHTDHLKKQTLPAPNSPLQAPKPPDPGYSSHSHNSQGGSPASLLHQLLYSLHAPLQHPIHPPILRQPPLSPCSGTPTLFPPIIHSAASVTPQLPTPGPVFPAPHPDPARPAPRPRPQPHPPLPPGLASPQRSALSARPGGPVLPMPGAGAGGARLGSPRAPAPPAAAPLPPRAPARYFVSVSATAGRK